MAELTEASSGVKVYPALLVFKILLLQQWDGSSDQDTEPNHSTICCFRNLLVENNLLDEVNAQMENQGKWSMTDLMLIQTISLWD
ncbi:hypothetical protein AGMMS49974_01330 [Deltaproteobacteria bacterium]|nr:hypothetical protein AGMMS49925_00130 [Deltaproteobacteria bacterium]GHU93489.1 hypothetical protein AGMMS49974_01330 [Deltaproteobacteria bacterium]